LVIKPGTVPASGTVPLIVIKGQARKNGFPLGTAPGWETAPWVKTFPITKG
jgi:hypothetical protein